METVGWTLSPQLADAATKAQKGPGRHADGGGHVPRRVADWYQELAVHVGAAKGSVLIGPWLVSGSSLAAAQSDEYRSTVALGGDPKAQRDKEAENRPSARAPTIYRIDQSLNGASARHAYRWNQSLTELFCQVIRTKRVSEIRHCRCAQGFSRDLADNNETASSAPRADRASLDFAKVKGMARR